MFVYSSGKRNWTGGSTNENQNEKRTCGQENAVTFGHGCIYGGHRTFGDGERLCRRLFRTHEGIGYCGDSCGADGLSLWGPAFDGAFEKKTLSTGMRIDGESNVLYNNNDIFERGI